MIPLFRRENPKGLTFVIDSSPRAMRLAIDPNIYLVKVPTPARIRLMTDAALSDLGGRHWNEVFHWNRTIFWQMSMLRSNTRPSNWQNDGG